jgi:Asp-tRNA(Asn)/Glu-tRNA(Gln) amidotransferase A subunit family amidase
VAGRTLNPYDTLKAPGGSSGGTATAVNASFAVLGLGTETGGSIQNPASAQGLVGVKPTYGLVPLHGVVPLSGTYVDVVGPIARSVYDAAVTLDVLAGPTSEDLATYAAVGHIPDSGYVAALTRASVSGRRFGLVGAGWRSDYIPLDPATEAEYRKAVGVLRALGAEVVEDPFLGTGFVEMYSARTGVPSQGTHDMFVYLRGLGPGAPFDSIEEWEMLAGRPYERGRGGGGGRGGRAGGQGGRGTPPVPARPSATEEGDAYQAWRYGLRNLFRRVLQDHDLDGLFFPQAGTPGRPLVEDAERPDYNPNNWAEIPSNIINDLGIPTVTVPVSYYADGMPFVIALIGDAWTEAELLAYAYELERATLARVPPRLVERPRD